MGNKSFEKIKRQIVKKKFEQVTLEIDKNLGEYSVLKLYAYDNRLVLKQKVNLKAYDKFFDTKNLIKISEKEHKNVTLFYSLSPVSPNSDEYDFLFEYVGFRTHAIFIACSSNPCPLIEAAVCQPIQCDQTCFFC